MNWDKELGWIARQSYISNDTTYSRLEIEHIVSGRTVIEAFWVADNDTIMRQLAAQSRYFTNVVDVREHPSGRGGAFH